MSVLGLLLALLGAAGAVELRSVRSFVQCDGALACQAGEPIGVYTELALAGAVSFSGVNATAFEGAWTLVPEKGVTAASLDVCALGTECLLMSLNTTVRVLLTRPRLAYPLDAVGFVPYGVALVNYSISNSRTAFAADPSVFAATAGLSCGGQTGVAMASTDCAETYPYAELSANRFAAEGWCGAGAYSAALTVAADPDGINALNAGGDCASGGLCYKCTGAPAPQNTESVLFRPLALGRPCTVYAIGQEARGEHPTFLVDVFVTVEATLPTGTVQKTTVAVETINLDSGPTTVTSPAGSLRVTVDLSAPNGLSQTLPGYVVTCPLPGTDGGPAQAGVLGPTNTLYDARGYVPTFQRDAEQGVSGAWQYWPPDVYDALLTVDGECGRLALLTELGQDASASTHDLYSNATAFNASCAAGEVAAGACVPGFVQTAFPATPCQIDTFNQNYSRAFLAGQNPAPTPYLPPDWDPEHPPYFLYYEADNLLLLRTFPSLGQGDAVAASITAAATSVIAPYNTADENVLIFENNDTLCAYQTASGLGFLRLRPCQNGSVPLTLLDVEIADCHEAVRFNATQTTRWRVATDLRSARYNESIALRATNVSRQCVPTDELNFYVLDAERYFPDRESNMLASCTVRSAARITASSGRITAWRQNQTMACSGVYLTPPELAYPYPNIVATWVLVIALAAAIVVVLVFIIVVIVIIVKYSQVPSENPREPAKMKVE